MEVKINLGSVFSGIGSIEQAFNQLELPYNIVFACDNGERELPLSYNEIKQQIKKEDENFYVKQLYDKYCKKNYVKETYFANYPIAEESWYEDIRFLDGKKYKNELDILVGGSPCQSFSLIGKRKGINDDRGLLIFDFINLISESKPKVFIYENVPGLLMNNHGETWEIVEKKFKATGYKIYKQILNSADYGIPQNRRRLFVIGFLDSNKSFAFPKASPLVVKAHDLYDNCKIDAKHYLGKKGFEFVTNSKYSGRAKINEDIIKTEKANQEYNWNGDFVFEPISKVKNNKEIMKRAYVGEYKDMKGVIRQLTYKECLRFMGFSEGFEYNKKNVQAYRQIGNAICVNVLKALLLSIIETGVFDESN